MTTIKSISNALQEPPLLYLWPVLLIAGVGIALWLLVPRPPNQLVIATGSQDGLYYRFGEALAKELAREKISLQVLPTTGSLENLEILSRPNSGVQLALAQGGAGNTNDWPNIKGLASVFNENAWLFFRASAFAKKPNKLSALEGKKVSIGLPGSGTRYLAEQLFALSQLDLAGKTAKVQVRDLDAKQSLQALQHGTLDAAFLVIAPGAPILKEYFQTPGISVMSFEHADAFALRLPFLQSNVIPQGAVDLKTDVPATPLKVISAPAALVVHDDIHPALITPIMRATESALKKIGLLEQPGAFPSSNGLAWPQNEDAAHYLNTGPSFLHRHLPFWGVVWVERGVRIILPLLILLFPLFKLLPGLIRFRVDSKTSAVYRQLFALEREWAANPQMDWKETLENIQEQAMRIRVPKRHMVDIYELRMHIDLVRQKLEAQ
jgi:uncharacterized protein